MNLEVRPHGKIGDVVTDHMKPHAKCLNEVDRALRKRKPPAELDVAFGIVTGGIYPVIRTKLVKKQRGQRPPVLAPTYCPFCGKKWIDE